VRGLGWSDDELTALVVQGYDVGSDPTVGSGQTAERYADRMRAAVYLRCRRERAQQLGLSAHLITADGQEGRPPRTFGNTKKLVECIREFKSCGSALAAFS
jgi:hypothetical protein